MFHFFNDLGRIKGSNMVRCIPIVFDGFWFYSSYCSRQH